MLFRSLFTQVIRKFVLSIFVTLALAVTAQAQSSQQKFEIPRSNVHIVHSDELSRDYPIFVRTPRGYDQAENNGRRYPVIYLNDGPYAFQIASGVTYIPSFGKRYAEVILVGISYAVGENAKASRTRDLTPIASDSSKSEIGPGTGGADDYLAFLETRLMPFVEKTYRADAARRTLAGHSFGGLFATWVLFNKPRLFENYIISSPSLWLNRKRMLEAEKYYADGHDDLKANVYFGTGALEKQSWPDLVADQIELVEKLRSRQYPNLAIRDQIITDIDHTLAFPINFTRAVQWIFHPTQR
jgi:hypothetical protein